MDGLTMGWVVWEAGKFLGLYFLLRAVLNRSSVGPDGEFQQAKQGIRAQCKNWLQRILTKL